MHDSRGQGRKRGPPWSTDRLPGDHGSAKAGGGRGGGQGRGEGGRVRGSGRTGGISVEHFAAGKRWTKSQKVTRKEKEFIHKKALLKSYRKLLKKEGFGPSLSTAQESGPGGMSLVPEGPLGEVSGGKRRLPPEIEKIGTEDEGLERCDTGPGRGELRKRTRMEAEESDGDSGGPPAAYRGDGGSSPQPGPARLRKGLKGTKAKPDPFARARQHALAKKEEAEEEALRREAKARALKKSAKVRRERHVLLSKTTRRGQPIMKTRIHGILDRLEREGRT